MFYYAAREGGGPKERATLQKIRRSFTGAPANKADSKAGHGQVACAFETNKGRYAAAIAAR